MEKRVLICKFLSPVSLFLLNLSFYSFRNLSEHDSDLIKLSNKSLFLKFNGRTFDFIILRSRAQIRQLVKGEKEWKKGF
jgi:hypothetical protein